jgi:hypothetical protein
MEINMLFGFVLTLVLIGVLLGIGLTILRTMETPASMNGSASQAINETITGIRSIPKDWLSIIIIVTVASIVLVLLIRNLGGAGGGKVTKSR